jgi:hypothetical protein
MHNQWWYSDAAPVLPLSMGRVTLSVRLAERQCRGCIIVRREQASTFDIVADVRFFFSVGATTIGGKFSVGCCP